MTIKASTPNQYVDQLPDDRKIIITKLRQQILNNIPKGFEEIMSYGFISYVVPKTIYPNGYHCKPTESLPFLSIASQKNFIAIYHMGIYADEKLLHWFVEEYKKQNALKLNMGKSCIRFQKFDAIPFELIGELAKKMTVQDWINIYEKQLKK